MSRDGHSGMSVRQAVSADAAALGVVGPAAYSGAYDYLWRDPAALAAHLDSFSADTFATLLAQASTAVWLAEYRNRVVGYLTLHLRSPCPICPEASDAELRRIYLLAPARGRGLGKELVASGEAHARQRGATRLWLDVMSSATKVQDTYRSWGFAAIGASTFNRGVRPELAGLVIMRRELTPDSAASAADGA